MKVELISHTENPQKVVACAAKLCYSKTGAVGLMDDMTDEAAAKFVRRLSSYGHDSPIEHASFTFAVEGVSRALLAQLTRHRIASYSVQSQRYVNMTDFKYIIPPDIDADDEMRTKFIDGMNADALRYVELRESLTKQHEEALVKEFHYSQEVAHSKAEKFANQDARFALPSACATNLVMTMNARSLCHFFNLRCCNRAQWEIRELAMKMYELVYPLAPDIFDNAGPGCVIDWNCPEGSLCCGRKDEVRAKFAEIKKKVTT